RVGRLDCAVTPLARLKVDDRLEEMPFPEIGPQHFRDVNLRVRDLPQQKIRYAQLAAGADEQIGIVDVRGVEMRCEKIFVDDGVAHLAIAPRGYDAIERVDNLRATAAFERAL